MKKYIDLHIIGTDNISFNLRNRVISYVSDYVDNHSSDKFDARFFKSDSVLYFLVLKDKNIKKHYYNFHLICLGKVSCL